MNDNRPKNYYALNLTEGRIFIIFISFIILLVVLIFGFLIIISNQNKSENINFKVDNEEFETLDNNDFVFYSDLTGEPDTDLQLNIEKTSSNIKLDNEENKVSKKDTNEFESKISDKKVVEEKSKSDDGLVTLDDLDVLYSSTFDDKIEIKKNPKKQESAAAKTTYTKEESIKISNKRYIVQIGSYINKETANDIEIYYKGRGYPTYIRSKNAEGKTYYRLRVGPFSKKNKAEEYLTALKKSKYGKNSYISIVYL